VAGVADGITAGVSDGITAGQSENIQLAISEKKLPEHIQYDDDEINLINNPI
jgi:hypothetical protein